jgi:hypothetical protein
MGNKGDRQVKKLILFAVVIGIMSLMGCPTPVPTPTKGVYHVPLIYGKAPSSLSSKKIGSRDIVLVYHTENQFYSETMAPLLSGWTDQSTPLKTGDTLSYATGIDSTQGVSPDVSVDVTVNDQTQAAVYTGAFVSDTNSGFLTTLNADNTFTFSQTTLSDTFPSETPDRYRLQHGVYSNLTGTMTSEGYDATGYDYLLDNRGGDSYYNSLLEFCWTQYITSEVKSRSYSDGTTYFGLHIHVYGIDGGGSDGNSNLSFYGPSEGKNASMTYDDLNTFITLCQETSVDIFLGWTDTEEYYAFDGTDWDSTINGVSTTTPGHQNADVAWDAVPPLQ